MLRYWRGKSGQLSMPRLCCLFFRFHDKVHFETIFRLIIARIPALSMRWGQREANHIAPSLGELCHCISSILAITKFSTEPRQDRPQYLSGWKYGFETPRPGGWNCAPCRARNFSGWSCSTSCPKACGARAISAFCTRTANASLPATRATQIRPDNGFGGDEAASSGPVSLLWSGDENRADLPQARARANCGASGALTM